MEKLPQLETDRLVLNNLKANDIPLIIKYASDPQISEFTLNLPHPYFEKDAVYWLNLANEGLRTGSRMIFAIRSKETMAFMGGISFSINLKNERAEAGYWIGLPFWNKGYVTEALKLMIKYGFEDLKLNKITSSHLGGNPSSGRVMEKAGLKKEGLLKKHLKSKMVFHDLVNYGLTKEEYLKQ